jgi:16S rRNA (adenine1518-N6/adenine1519-N6)-dimethyltransferase
VTQIRHQRARKALGQHWLTDRGFLQRIAQAAHIADDETVIEVGSGTGALTNLLHHPGRRLIAVEVDPTLAAGLRAQFRGSRNVAVVQRDVLSVPPEDLLREGGGSLPYVVVGNLPFYIGTAIVRHFLTATAQPRRLVVTLQAEVAESIAAEPGRMSYLGVETQMFARPEVLFRIPPGAFHPPPKVSSAVLRLDVPNETRIEIDDGTAFLELVRAGFAAPRKRVRNSLAVGSGTPPAEAEAILKRAGVDPTARPAALDLHDWQRVYAASRERQS